MTTPYYADEHVTLYLGDALAVAREMPTESANCIVTSPPYFGLRDYGSEGQYGLESSPAEYVEKMRLLFCELRRVLADDGTLWLNIGDTYAGRANGGASVGPTAGHGRPNVIPKRLNQTESAPYKSLLGIPWRVALSLIDSGWTLRQEVIWAKRSCMPEAVTDRPSRAHEQVFLLTKGPRYWFDAEAIREDSDPDQQAHNERYAKVYSAQANRAAATGQPGNVNSAGVHSRPGRPGRNSRSVWSLSTQPFPGAHFAVMPSELARRCVASGCRPGGTVLDPFSGSGTTGLVASQLGHRYVGIDLSSDYLDLSLKTRLAQTALIDGAAS